MEHAALGRKCLWNYPQSTVAVSVVIPMFNAEKYIAVMLESLLAQTFTNFKVIIVDDCLMSTALEQLTDAAK